MRGAVDEAGEHVGLVGAVHVEVAVEGVEVEALVRLELEVGVADDVLDRDVAELELHAGKEGAQGVEAVHGREQDLDEALAAGEHHLARGEEQRRALRGAEADGDGRELLLLVDRVWQESTDGLEVEAARALELARADEVVHLREGGGLRGAHRLVDVLELDEDVLVHLAAREPLLARGTSKIFPAHGCRARRPRGSGAMLRENFARTFRANIVREHFARTFRANILLRGRSGAHGRI